MEKCQFSWSGAIGPLKMQCADLTSYFIYTRMLVLKKKHPVYVHFVSYIYLNVIDV